MERPAVRDSGLWTHLERPHEVEALSQGGPWGLLSVETATPRAWKESAAASAVDVVEHHVKMPLPASRPLPQALGRMWRAGGALMERPAVRGSGWWTHLERAHRRLRPSVKEDLMGRLLSGRDGAGAGPGNGPAPTPPEAPPPRRRVEDLTAGIPPPSAPRAMGDSAAPSSSGPRPRACSLALRRRKHLPARTEQSAGTKGRPTGLSSVPRPRTRPAA